MHADPTDRILSTDPTDAALPRLSVPRIFAIGLVLPFTHPLRLLIASLVPAALIAWMAFGPFGRAMDTWTAIMAARTSGAMPDVPPTFGVDILESEGILLVAGAVWLCAWQRAAARNFAEPLRTWLTGALLRFPGYLAALLLWVMAPAIIILLAFLGAAWVVQRSLGSGSGIMPTTPTGQLFAYADALTPLQWWVLAAGMLTMIGMALWLSARLAPLPALVASQGWRRSFGEAWRLSSGHGFGLAVSLFSYSLLGILATGIVSAAIGIALFAGGDVLDPTRFAKVGAVIDLAMTGIIILWHGSLGALVVREGAVLSGAIDPAMFD